MSDYSIYPKAIDGFAQIPLAVDRQSPVNAEGVNRLRSGIINIENTLGVAPHISGRFGDFNSVGDRITNLEGEHSDLADIVSELADPTLDIVYHFGQSILMDNGPINLTGNDYFMFNDESGAPVGAIDAGSSLRILSSGTDLVLNAGGEEKDVVLRPGPLGLNEDLGEMIPGTIRVEPSDTFSLGPGSLSSYMVFGDSFLNSRAIFLESHGPDTFTLAVGFGSMVDPSVTPYGLELTVLEHSAPDTPGRGVGLSASPGTGTEPGGPIKISSGDSFGDMGSSYGSSAIFDGGTKDNGGQISLEAGSFGVTEGAVARLEGGTGVIGGRVSLIAGARSLELGASLELAGGNSPEGGSAILAAGSGDTDPGGEVSVHGGDSETNNGGDLFLQAGGALGGSGGDGGTSHIHAGNSLSGIGGTMQISAGDSDSSDPNEPGGDAHFIGGNSNTANGGNVNIDSGDSVGGVTGSTSIQTRGGNTNIHGTGELAIRTGSSLSGDTGQVVIESGATAHKNPTIFGNSGPLRVASGNTTHGGSGEITVSSGDTTVGGSGVITVSTGATETGPGGSSPSGDINIFTGDGWEVGGISISTGQSLTNISGAIQIESGAAHVLAPSGELTFKSGDTSGGSVGSGNVSMQSGASGGGGDSGPAFVFSGSAGDGGNSGAVALGSGPADDGGMSGNIMVQTGDSTDLNGTTGGLMVKSGDANGASGNLVIQTGSSATADAGNIDLIAGTGSIPSYDGSINIDGKTNIFAALSLPITTWTSVAGPGGNVFTIDDQHFTILVNSQVLNTTIHLPDANTTPGRIYNIKRVDSSGFTPRVSDPNGNLIDGMLVKTLSSQWDSYTFQSDGNNWYII